MDLSLTCRPSPAQHRRRQWQSRLLTLLMGLSTVLVMTPLFLVLYFLIREGASALDWNFFTQLPKPAGEVGGGMANAIVGTLVLLAMASIVGVPIGIFGGIYLAEYGSDGANSWIRFAADVLNGVPSIVWGMVIYLILGVP